MWIWELWLFENTLCQKIDQIVCWSTFMLAGEQIADLDSSDDAVIPAIQKLRRINCRCLHQCTRGITFYILTAFETISLSTGGIQFFLSLSTWKWLTGMLDTNWVLMVSLSLIIINYHENQIWCFSYCKLAEVKSRSWQLTFMRHISTWKKER